MLMNNNLVCEGLLKDLKIHLTALEQEKPALNAKIHELASLRIKDTYESTTYFRIERFRNKKADLNALTGMPSTKIFYYLFEVCGGYDSAIQARLQYKVPEDFTEADYPLRPPSVTRHHILNFENQYFLTMIRMRTGLPYNVLHVFFGILESTAQRYFRTWIMLMYNRLRQFQQPLKGQVILPPNTAKLFPSLTGIIDAFEIEIQHASNPTTQKQTFNSHKWRNAVKVLLIVRADGTVYWISHMYHGRISDKDMVIQTKVLDLFQAGDVVLADRGFKLHQEAAAKNIIWLAPPSATGSRGFSKDELRKTVDIDSIHILVEREIRSIKAFLFLIPHCLVTKLLYWTKL